MSLDISETELERKEKWESWLGDASGHYLNKIRESAKKIYEENLNRFPEIPFYTPHGITHCEAVENLIHRLIPGDAYKKLREKERFYLLSSAWLHDLGMLRMVAQEICNKNLTDTEIRKEHHITSEKFIVEQYNRCGLEEADKEFIGILCKYHRRQENLNDCVETMSVGNEKFNLRLLAAYLRLADALHVGTSRTPTPAYAICLAYDIPAESKLHWIKSKFVNGIDIDADTHIITIEFRTPYRKQVEENMPLSWSNYMYKINYILKLVKDDLYDELTSVVNVMTQNGISYYLDIKEKRTCVVMTRQMLNDIRELAINYDILLAPSASKLLEMILVTIANIAGYHLVKDKDNPIKYDEGSMTSREDRKKQLDDFIESLKTEILKNRPCHLGLETLIIKCHNLMEKYLPADPARFINEINDLYKLHNSYRRNIRKNAQNFFNYIYGNKKRVRHVSKSDFQDDNLIQRLLKENIIEKFNKGNTNYVFNSNIKDEDSLKEHLGQMNIEPIKQVLSLWLRSQTFTILLFGYSELVIKAICGFRDYLMDYAGNPKDLYDSILEKKTSRKMRIFICEGQSKTQTGPNNRLLYHDGAQYALSLAERNFRNLIIIPDIVVENIIKHNSIDLLMVGANGFTNDSFKHSAGHSSIINLVREHRNQGNTKDNKSPKTVLVVSSEKWLPDSNSNSNESTIYSEISEPYSKRDVDGYWFWQGTEKNSTREHIWMLRDSNIKNKLYENEIMFYNPREDVIPIEYVDYIISNIKYYPISTEDKKVISKNTGVFIKDVKEFRKNLENKSDMKS